jgi:hypothetical protein
MANVDRLAVHEGTAADDARDPGLPALLDGRRRDAPLAERAVQPDAWNLPLRRLPHDGE